MKTVQEAFAGEILYDPLEDPSAISVPELRAVKPTVYAGLFPVENSDYESLRQAVERLCLNDPSVTIAHDVSPVLGMGWRVGFLGLLHLEVSSSFGICSLFIVRFSLFMYFLQPGIEQDFLQVGRR